jgi:hypothetical protein
MPPELTAKLPLYEYPTNSTEEYPPGLMMKSERLPDVAPAALSVVRSLMR